MADVGFMIFIMSQAPGLGTVLYMLEITRPTVPNQRETWEVRVQLFDDSVKDARHAITSLSFSFILCVCLKWPYLPRYLPSCPGISLLMSLAGDEEIYSRDQTSATKSSLGHTYLLYGE